MNTLEKAFIAGAERISAWSGLLDSINVFPVADGDTGSNLKLSLTPLRELGSDKEKAIHQLLISARGNSGNIAARFFSGFLTARDLESIPGAVQLGRDRAWKAVNDPKPGTMLTIFDALSDFLEKEKIIIDDSINPTLMDHLEKAVKSTIELLPVLKEAEVVDAGALAMYIYLEGFFKTLSQENEGYISITDVFDRYLTVSPTYHGVTEDGYCVDLVLESTAASNDTIDIIKNLGDSIVVISDDNVTKVHFHTDNKDEIRKKLESSGTIVKWSADDLEAQTREFSDIKEQQAIHIMTDAAGSFSRSMARELGITLLDSYINIGDASFPETMCKPEEIYKAMRESITVTTSQASLFEKHQYYESVTDVHGKTLYLCVGSAYTGNYDTAAHWKKTEDRKDRLTILDTGAASGRLGTIALTTGRYSLSTSDTASVIEYADKASKKCEEYLFIDNLKYLARGGRVSRTNAFFGNMFHVKPIISPLPGGVEKMGIARNSAEQISFALTRLESAITDGTSPLIMLQYTDNRDWVEDEVLSKITELYPAADILFQPLSLTTGVHTGPGTWAIAFLPEMS